MTAIAIFFGARHGVGPPRHPSTPRANGSGLPDTSDRGRLWLVPAVIWGMPIIWAL